MTLTNQCLTDAYVRPMYPRTLLHPNDMMMLTVLVQLPEDCKDKKKILLAFAFQDSDHDECGERMFGIIDIVNDQQEDDERSSLADSEPFRRASEDDNEYLYGLASELNEDGYGEFNRCLLMLKACKGNVDEAKMSLSNLVFEEFQ